jgi:hypothetical protein
MASRSKFTADVRSTRDQVLPWQAAVCAASGTAREALLHSHRPNAPFHRSSSQPPSPLIREMGVPFNAQPLVHSSNVCSDLFWLCTELLALLVLVTLILYLCPISADFLGRQRIPPSDDMTYTIDLVSEGHAPTIWPLRRLTRCDVVSLEHSDDFFSAGDCELQLDRGNAEFGLLCPLDDATSVMVQCIGDKPVCFKASDALAVCHRYSRQGGAAMKVCVLMPDYQIDLEFEDAVHAQCFIAALKGLATNALMVYETPG